ncbi:MAG TPA: hypothetical protein VLJ39_21695, partial [Tepidisphaeraceae bacterium]|nr:hypothetical protein [Tepidisphaeraceae bacterium]
MQQPYKSRRNLQETVAQKLPTTPAAESGASKRCPDLLNERVASPASGIIRGLAANCRAAA